MICSSVYVLKSCLLCKCDLTKIAHQIRTIIDTLKNKVAICIFSSFSLFQSQMDTGRSHHQLHRLMRSSNPWNEMQCFSMFQEYQSFTDLKNSKNKTVTCIDWHPTLKGQANNLKNQFLIFSSKKPLMIVFFFQWNISANQYCWCGVYEINPPRKKTPDFR